MLELLVAAVDVGISLREGHVCGPDRVFAEDAGVNTRIEALKLYKRVMIQLGRRGLCTAVERHEVC